MACAALVQVGPARQSFWAVLTRADGRLRERTRMARRGAIELVPGRPATDDARRARAPASPRRRRAARLATRGRRGDRGALPARRRAGVDAQAGRHPRSRHARLDGGQPRQDRGAGGDRRHRRLPRPLYRVVVERRGRYRSRRNAAGVEPRRRRQRPSHRLRARGVGRRRAARERSGQLRKRPLADPCRGRLRAPLHSPRPSAVARRTC